MAAQPRVTRFQIDWTPLAVQQQLALQQQMEQLQQQQLQLQQQHAQQQHLAMLQAGMPTPAGTGGMPAPPLYGSGAFDAPFATAFPPAAYDAAAGGMGY